MKKGTILIIAGLVLLLANVVVLQAVVDTTRPEYTLEYMIPESNGEYSELDFVRFLCRDLESGIKYVGFSVWQEGEVGEEFLLNYEMTVGPEQPVENETEAPPETPPPGLTLIDSLSRNYGGTDIELNSVHPTTESETVSAGGQSFTSSSFEYKIVVARFYLAYQGSPTGYLRAVLYEHTGEYGTSESGVGTKLAESNSVDISTITSSQPSPQPWQVVDFTFEPSQQYSMNVNTHYFIAVTVNDATLINNSNDVFIQMNYVDEPNSAHDGCTMGYTDAVGWYAWDKGDIPFAIYGTSTSAPSGSFTVTFKCYYYIDPLSHVRVYFGPVGGPMESKLSDDDGLAIWYDVSVGNYEYSAIWLTLIKDGVLTVDVRDERVALNFWSPGGPIQIVTLEETWEVWELNLDPSITEPGEYKFQFYFYNEEGLNNAIPVGAFTIIETGEPTPVEPILGEPRVPSEVKEQIFQWPLAIVGCGFMVGGVLMNISERRRKRST